MKRETAISYLFSLAAMLVGVSHGNGEMILAEDDFATMTLDGGVGWNSDWTILRTSDADSSVSAATGEMVTRHFASLGAANETSGVARSFALDGNRYLETSFDFTPTEFSTPGGNAAQDRFEFHGRNSNGLSPAGSSVSTWLIYGGEDISGFQPQPPPGNTWQLHNGTRNGRLNNGGGGENDLVDTGLVLRLDETYRFTIFEDFQTGAYTANVVNLDTAEAFQSGWLGYRTGNTTGENASVSFTARHSSSRDRSGFILDNVMVSVPEPSSGTLGCLVLSVGWWRKR